MWLGKGRELLVKGGGGGIGRVPFVVGREDIMGGKNPLGPRAVRGVGGNGLIVLVGLPGAGATSDCPLSVFCLLIK